MTNNIHNIKTIYLNMLSVIINETSQTLLFLASQIIEWFDTDRINLEKVRAL